jgi:aquaporin rerated protein, other eukaryote
MQPLQTLTNPSRGSNSKSEGDVAEPNLNQRPPLLPKTIQDEITVAIGEFCGTFMFLFMSYIAVQIASFSAVNDPDPSVPNVSRILFIASAFGISLAANVWIFYRVSGGLFNPAVSKQDLHNLT